MSRNIFLKVFLRSTLRKPGLLIASILGVASGTAVLCALNIANERALNSFSFAAGDLTSVKWAVSKKRHSVQFRAKKGRIPPRELDRCLAHLNQGLICRGVLTGSVGSVLVIGVDGTLETFVTPAFSTAMGTTEFKGLRAVSLFPSPTSAVVVDTATASRLLGVEPAYDWIEVSADDEERLALPAYGNEFRQTSVEEEEESQEALTFSYRFNLRVLGLMSIAVGALLVSNVAALYALLKKPTISVLRQLGATRSRILRWILFEQALLGVIGGVAGLAPGIRLEDFVSAQVLRTLSDLYLKTAATEASFSVGNAALTVLAGAGIFLAAGFVSTLQMTRVQPAALSKRSSVQTPRGRSGEFAAAVFCLVCIFASPYVPPVRVLGSPQPLAGYFAAICVFALCYFLASSALKGCAGAAKFLSPSKYAEKLPAFAIAARRALQAGVRGCAATATLAGGLSLAIGTHIMVGGFRESLTTWLERAFYSELVGEGKASEEDLKRLRAIPGVEGVDCLLLGKGKFRESPVKFGGVENALLPGRSAPIYVAQGGTPEEVAGILNNDRETVVVSEALATKQGISIGDRVKLEGFPHEFTVNAIVREYSSELGYFLMNRKLYAEQTGLDGCHSMRIYTHLTAAEIQPHAPDVRIFSGQELRTNAIKTFNQTFAITGVLTVLAATLGGLSLLTQLVQATAERAQEWLTLRRLGNTWFGLMRICAYDILFSIAAGIFLGLFGGLLLGWILCFSINKQAFGWSVNFGSQQAFLECMGISLAVGVGIGLTGVFLSWLVLKPGEKWRIKRE